MKKEFHISTWVNEPALLENLVEQLATQPIRRYRPAEKLTTDLKSVETASTHTYVSGTLQMEQGDGREAILLKPSFVTQFYFTCLRESEDEYRLQWAVSLS